MDMQISRQQAAGGASGHLTIDLGALRDNYLALAAMAPACQTAAVVKADAYGLGADMVSQTLFDAGCRHFFVAHIDEALALRLRLPAQARIFVLNGLQPGNETSCAAMAITPVLNSLEQIAQWAVHAKTLGRKLAAAVQIDTGMCRLGLSPEELETLTSQPQLLDGIDIAFVMSHLACADEPRNAMNQRQLESFRHIREMFPDVESSLANSAGIFRGADYHFEVTRPGIALYGGAAVEGVDNPMRPVVTAEARILQIRRAAAGQFVGYGGTGKLARDSVIAIVAAGYADGYPRAASGAGVPLRGALAQGAAGFLHGRDVPLLGRISMDLSAFDVTDVDPELLAVGDYVELFGPNMPIDRVARAAGTISYELLTNLGRRFHRTYLGHDA